MIRALAIALAGFALFAQPGPVRAQDTAQQTEARGPAILVADSVFITPDRTLVAEGNVEAFQGDTRLRARKITYDREAGILTVEGPIRIDEGGEITVLANYAELDRDLQNGLLTGARMVFQQQLQLASLQMTRVGGRYTQLYKTAVTSCHVCDGKPPLWQIRARKITHDQQERQLYFEDAQLRVLDVPVFYFPGMRLPDPTLKRARGFLIPSVRTTSNLGTGVIIPYFFPLGDSADLTLAPYISPQTRTLNYRYRQAFRKGRIDFEGAFTKDDLIPDRTRYYVFGRGFFELPRGYQFAFDIQTVSDNAYLVDYGLPDLDRLESEVSISRYRRDSAFRTRFIYSESLRDTDDNSLLPTIVFDAAYQRRFFPTAIGGELRLGLFLHDHHRTSNLDVLGRDVTHATIDAAWLRTWIFANGLRTDTEIGFSADTFKVRQDSNYDSRIDVVTPRAAVRLSYPLSKVTPTGAVHFIEPIVQLGWAGIDGDVTPNDESTFVEFDPGNLLALSRFPSVDRRETGPTLVYGLNWTRIAPSGWQTSATVGQVFRDESDPAFTRSSGLYGTSSDVLLAGQVRFRDNLSLTARTLLDDAFSLSKAELRGDWLGERGNLSGTYLWLGPDLAEGRIQQLSEVWLSGGYELNRGWTGNADVRYDISDARATRAGLGLVYQNECVTVDLRVNRRYTSSSSVEPVTDFGFTIALSGFSVESGADKYSRSCS